jgi:hypothetical protein
MHILIFKATFSPNIEEMMRFFPFNLDIMQVPVETFSKEILI